jgi:hypothetical protein
MNPTLSAFARQTLKEGLAQLPAGNQRMFKLMYALEHRIGKPDCTAEAREAVPINDVVDAMSEEKLDWAMIQVERTLTKIANQKPN